MVRRGPTELCVTRTWWWKQLQVHSEEDRCRVGVDTVVQCLLLSELCGGVVPGVCRRLTGGCGCQRKETGSELPALQLGSHDPSRSLVFSRSSWFTLVLSSWWCVCVGEGGGEVGGALGSTVGTPRPAASRAEAQSGIELHFLSTVAGTSQPSSFTE